MKKLIYILALFLFVSVSVVAQYQKITPFDAAQEDAFGWTASISGDYMVIGNVYDDDMGIQSGAIYIYHFNGTDWEFQQKIVASDGGFAEYFGYRVEIEGNRIICGAYRGNDNSGVDVGTAYIYEYDGTIWNEVAILQPPGGEYDDRFGQYVDIYGDYAIVGATGDDDLGADCGAAYLYGFNGTDWMLVEKITPATIEEGSVFGMDVTISDQYMAVSAGRDIEAGIESGTVYMYEFDGTDWVFEEIIVPNDATAGQYFGSAVELSGNKLVVGAYHDNIYGENSGSAYVFNHNGTDWVQDQKLIPPYGNEGNLFGARASISGNEIIVGSLFYWEGTYNSGAVFFYHYDNENWIYETTLMQPDPVIEARFGAAVSVSGTKAIIGAPFDDDNGYRSGSAYAWELSGYVGMNESPQNSIVTVFPTITDGVINLRFSENNDEIQISIIDISGKVILEGKNHSGSCNFKMDLSHVEPGLYFVCCESDGERFVGKVVVR